MKRRQGQAGVTLIEMLMVVSLIGLLAGITFPAVSSGVDSLRLSSASDSVVSLLNAALNRAERRQMVMEVIISRDTHTLSVRSGDGLYRRELALPEGVTIVRILPPTPAGDEERARSLLLLPGGTVPRVGVELQNRRGARRIVRVDPLTGVPHVEPL